jgi:pSer/pThr/pTyr-binding forkhead associated (FHA) protein
MAYLVFSSQKGEEIGRRRLEGPVTVGRAPDCDVSLHDHLLSRHHCRLAPSDDGWVLTDLGSKNGTIVQGTPVTQHVLQDGESFMIGRVKVRFRAAALDPAKETAVATPRQKRPTDPFDALSGTVAGFRYEPPPDEKHLRDVEQFPAPKPVVTDSGRFVAMTDSGRFVGVTDDVWLNDRSDESAGAATAGIVAEGSAAKSDPELASRPLVRPKAPEGADHNGVPTPELPGPPPLPPKRPVRLWLAPFLKRIGRTLNKPLARWAAVLLGLGALGAALLLSR